MCSSGKCLKQFENLKMFLQLLEFIPQIQLLGKVKTSPPGKYEMAMNSLHLGP